MFTVRWELILNYSLHEFLTKYFSCDAMWERCALSAGEDLWLGNGKRDHIHDLGVDGG